MVLEKNYKNVTIKYNKEDISTNPLKIFLMILFICGSFFSIVGLIYLSRNISKYYCLLFLVAVPLIFVLYKFINKKFESKYLTFLLWALNQDNIEARWEKRRPIFTVTNSNGSREMTLKEFAGDRDDIRIVSEIPLKDPVKIEIDTTGENFYVRAERNDEK